MHAIEENVTEQLYVIPAVLQVKRIHWPLYGCRSYEGSVVQTVYFISLLANRAAQLATFSCPHTALQTKNGQLRRQ